MKKTLIFLLLFRSVLASPIGNPADPAVLEEGFWIPDHCWSSLRTGVTGDFLFAKRLRPCHRLHDLMIYRPELNWRLAVADVGWNIRERFDIHLLAGPVSSVDFQWRQAGSAYVASGNQGLFWGASSKLIVLDVKDTTVGFDFHGGGIQWIRGPITQNGRAFIESFSSHLYFWQIAGGLSQNIGLFKPYIGAVVNQFASTITFSHPRLRFHDFLQIGAFEGCSLSLGKRVFLNVEARQFFESGLAVSGEIRF